MIKINIENTVPESIVDLDLAELENACRFVLAKENFSEGELSLVIVGDEEITQLKRDYFDIDATTDVVSFDLSDEDCPDYRIDAEIAINAQLAARESQDRACSASAELILYAVHGILHQAGYDDHEPDDYRQMHTRENELLTELGLGQVFGELDE